jgi:hypothetical protein
MIVTADTHKDEMPAYRAVRGTPRVRPLGAYNRNDTCCVEDPIAAPPRTKPRPAMPAPAAHAALALS